MLNYKKEGKGKTTPIFLHGWGGSWQSWAPIIEKLKDKFTIYALDLPGFGLSNLSRGYSLHDYVAEILVFFESNKIGSSVLIGHSFGGQVAIKFALTNPKLVSKLILVDAAGVRDNSLKLRSHIQIARWGKKLVQTTPLSRYTPQIAKIYYKLRGIEDNDYFQASHNPNLKKTLGIIMREDLSGEFHKIKSPTLIFWGEKDPTELTPITQAHILNKEIKHSKLVVIPGASHFSYLDVPDKFCEEIIKFTN